MLLECCRIDGGACNRCRGDGVLLSAAVNARPVATSARFFWAAVTPHRATVPGSKCAARKLPEELVPTTPERRHRTSTLHYNQKLVYTVLYCTVQFQFR